MEKSRATWGSKFGYIMAAAGFSVGLGNIWRFPYLAGMNGGGAFVLVYVLICLMIGYPMYLAEAGLGRKMQANPVAAIRGLSKKGSWWPAIGWLGAAVCVVLLSYYLVIMGWMFAYFVKMLIGSFNGLSADQVVKAFTDFQADPVQTFLWTALVVVALAIISFQGLKDGIERVCKVLMPILIVMLVVLAVRSLTLPGAMEGVKWYLTPDFSKITPDVCLAALGQSFFSIGIASSCAIIYGSFLNKDSNIPVSACQIVGMDTGIALLAGIVIFPALFSFGMEPASGMGLVFQTMPHLFNQMPLGNIFGGMFFLMIFFAGLTSAIGYLEGATNIIQEEFNLSRKKAVLYPLIIIVILSIPCILSLNPNNFFSSIVIKDRNLFDFADFLSGNVMMPINAFLICMFVIFVWKFENYKNDVNVGATKIKVANWWKVLIYVLIPVAIGFITVTGIM